MAKTSSKPAEKAQPVSGKESTEGLTYTETVQKIAKEVGISGVNASQVCNKFLAAICDGLKKNGHFRMGSLGSFNVKLLGPRKVRNPQTGDTFEVGERQKIRFKPGTKMVETVFGTISAKPEKTTKAAKPEKTAKTAKPKSTPSPAPVPASKKEDESFDL